MIKKILTFILSSSVAIAIAGGFYNPWEDIQRPSSGQQQIYGGYNAGCVQGASAPEETGFGYQYIELSRNKFWGHSSSHRFVERMGKILRPQGISLLVADVSMPRGGPFTWDHASHQVGLDLDIEFHQDPRSLQRDLTVEERERLPKFYLADRETNAIIERNWSDKYLTMLRTFAEDTDVHVMFVHPAIKKKICENPANRKSWLAKVQPWWGHDEHVHVRLRCPSDSPNCVPKPAFTEIGCDSEEFLWWFSDDWRRVYEARKKWQRDNPNPEPEPLPALPAQCQGVLRDGAAR
ncbi:MAG: Penicillin-insensitive murein endopeptidase precursor [Pseudomonadota bacterium]|jgi:penicillin-insensitive murein endopeptidase